MHARGRASRGASVSLHKAIRPPTRSRMRWGSQLGIRRCWSNGRASSLRFSVAHTPRCLPACFIAPAGGASFEASSSPAIAPPAKRPLRPECSTRLRPVVTCIALLSVPRCHAFKVDRPDMAGVTLSLLPCPLSEDSSPFDGGQARLRKQGEGAQSTISDPNFLHQVTKSI